MVPSLRRTTVWEPPAAASTKDWFERRLSKTTSPQDPRYDWERAVHGARRHANAIRMLRMNLSSAEPTASSTTGSAPISIHSREPKTRRASMEPGMRPIHALSVSLLLCALASAQLTVTAVSPAKNQVGASP